MKRPILTPLTIPEHKMKGTTQGLNSLTAILEAPLIPQAPLSPPLENTLEKNNQPITTTSRLNPVYHNPSINKMRMGERLLYYLSQVKQRFPKSIWILLLLVLASIVFPLIMPLAGAGAGILPLLGLGI